MIMLRLTLRGLAAHRLRFLLTGFSVVLGVAFVSGTLILTDTMDRAFTRMFEGMDADIAAVVRPQQEFAQGFAAGGEAGTATLLPDDLAGDLAEVEEIQAVYPMAEGTAAVLGPDGEEIGGQGPPQIGTTWHDRPGSGSGIVAGRGPRGGGEFVLDQGSARAAGLSVGDSVTVRAGGEDRDMILVGVFRSGQLGSTAGSTVAAFDLPTAQRLLLGDPDRVNAYYLDGVPGKSQWQIADAAAPLLEPGMESLPMDIVRDEQLGPMREALDYFGVFLLTFAGIGLFVGSFLIFNTFAMLVAQRGRELALLRAIGAGQEQVRGAITGEALGVGLVGSGLGLAAGVGLAWSMLAAVEALGIDLPDTGLRVTPLTVAAAFLVGTGVTVLAAYVPIRRGTRVPPVAAMRDDAGSAVAPSTGWGRAAAGLLALPGGAALLWAGVRAPSAEAAPWLVGFGAGVGFLAVALLMPHVSRPLIALMAAPFPAVFRVAGRLGRDNAVRSPRRTAATATALMIGLGLVAAIATLSASASRSVDVEIDRALGADYIVTTDGPTETVSADALDRLREVDGVDTVVPMRIGQAQVDGELAFTVSAAPAGLERTVGMEVVRGAAQFDGEGFMVAESVADRRGWRVGREVSFVFPDGGEADLELQGVYSASQAMRSDYLVSPAAYRAHFPQDLTLSVYLTADHASPRVRGAVDTALADHPALEVMDRGELKERNRENLALLTNTIYAMLLLSIVIAGLGIINTLALATAERVREIGLLRAVGLSRVQLRRMIRLEAVVIALLGAVVGVVLGLVFAWALQQVLAERGVTVLDVPAGQLVGLLGVAVVIGVLAALWPAWRASRLDILRAIAAE
ncbi:putative ABC transport system permease protein [Streptomonospora nanhaiensis]|uniref:Putative ABC transport system permease protein n=2 Tax=Streptomonospora nanhaiensis TaxID=1323731 RepID=A0A853BGX0_9ACTN|nr:putative ABC transport system permease protein [Streptomonospora nanhaiensis]